jgi:hypothetical protein
VDDDILKVFGGVALVVAALLVFPLLGATLGAFSGWVVGFVWGDTILGVLRSIGLQEKITMTQIGCTAGFLGGFVKTRLSTEKKK